LYRKRMAASARRCRNVPLHRQSRQELLDLWLAHFRRVPLAMEDDEPFDRVRVSGIQPTYATSAR
jgi:hypothetical protein